MAVCTKTPSLRIAFDLAVNYIGRMNETATFRLMYLLAVEVNVNAYSGIKKKMEVKLFSFLFFFTSRNSSRAKEQKERQEKTQQKRPLNVNVCLGL